MMGDYGHDFGSTREKAFALLRGALSMHNYIICRLNPYKQAI